MHRKAYMILGISMIVVSVLLISVSFFISSIFLMISSIILLLVSILYLFFMMSYNLFKSDKELDIELLRKQGFTIVKCNNCTNNNVLEDQYCVFCGEKLGNNDEQSI